MDAIFRHGEYEIVVKPMPREVNYKIEIRYNAYVKHPKFEEYRDEDGNGYDLVNNCTYHRGDTIGFDTGHMYNDTMTDAELFADALRQAIEFLDEVIDGKEV